MLVENDIDRKNIELARRNPELQKYHEDERKFDPTAPELFDAFKAIAVPIEQIYLSHPDEPFSLRLRRTFNLDGTTSYSAALKDKGEMVNGELSRLEVPVENLSAEAYEFYSKQEQFPRLYKSRAHVAPGVDIDFIEGRELPLIEVEPKDGQGKAFLKDYGAFLVDRSDDPSMQNESIAHSLHPYETLQPSQETNEAFVNRVMNDVVARYCIGYNQVVVGLSGMSGAGKSTATRLLSERLQEEFGEEFVPIVLSTDDYHFGKKHLEATYGAPYSQWDAPHTYDTQRLADDLATLAKGESIAHRRFDFDLEETVEDGVVAPKPFVIIEGLYAGSPDLAKNRLLHYTMPAGIATSIGRDVRRLVIENRANRAFPAPEDRLRYQLEVALPTYLSQERPKRNSFAAHSRPLAERAFLLEKLTR